MTRLSTPAILSLTALTLHISVLSIVLYLSTRSSNSKSTSYKASSAVTITEILKVIICILFAFLNGELRPIGFERKRLRNELEQEEFQIELMESIARDNSKQEEENVVVDKVSKSHPMMTVEVRRRSVNSEGVLSPRAINNVKELVSAKGCRIAVIPPTPGINDTPTTATWDDSNLYPGRISLPNYTSSPLSPSYPTLALDLLDLDMWYSLRESIFGPGWWKLAVPAVLFMFQANAQYLASGNLSVPTAQLAYQLKIPATALASVIVLKRSLTVQQWFSLMTLTFGVAIVQTGQTSSTPSVVVVVDSTNLKIPNPVLGLTAVVLACISSGFASTYFEKVLKAKSTSSTAVPITPPSVWIRNIQLSLFGLIVLIPVIYYDQLKGGENIDWEMIRNGGGWIEISTGIGKVWLGEFFEGFDSLTWIVIILQVIGGLLGGLVVAYADNILKVFSTSLSVVISCAASIYFFDFQPSLIATFGASLVLFSTYVYTLPAKGRS